MRTNQKNNNEKEIVEINNENKETCISSSNSKFTTIIRNEENENISKLFIKFS